MYGLKDWKVRQFDSNSAATLEETLNRLETERWNIFSIVPSQHQRGLDIVTYRDQPTPYESKWIRCLARCVWNPTPGELSSCTAVADSGLLMVSSSLKN